MYVVHMFKKKDENMMVICFTDSFLHGQGHDKSISLYIISSHVNSSEYRTNSFNNNKKK